MNYKDITSHQKACEILGKDPKESTSIHDQLDDIANAINKIDNFTPDYGNRKQEKWYPIFDASSGFRFDYSYYGLGYSASFVSSRLCQRFSKEEIANFFGKQFEPMHIKAFYGSMPKIDFKSITSHEIACRVLNKVVNEHASTDQKITDICNAINSISGFKVDFKNSNQRKWRSYFIMDSSGFRFVYSYSAYDVTDSFVGSRLCHFVATEEEADHIGKIFFELHKAHYMGE